MGAAWPTRQVRLLVVLLAIGAVLVRGWAILGGELDGRTLASLGSAYAGAGISAGVSPLESLMSGVISHLAPLAYWPVALVLLALWIAYVALAARASRTLLGDRPSALVLLALLCLSPMSLPGSTTWPTAVGQLCLAMGCVLVLDGAARWGRRESLPGAASIVLGVVVALAGAAPLTWAPGLLVALWATVLVLDPALTVAPPSERPGWRHRLPLALAVVCLPVAWCALLLTWPVGPLPRDLGGVATYVGEAIASGILPSLAGGPVGWTSPWPGVLWAAPPLWLVLIGLQVVVIGVAATVMLRGRPLRSWVIGIGFSIAALSLWALGSAQSPAATGRELLGATAVAAFLALPASQALGQPQRPLAPIPRSPQAWRITAILCLDAAIAMSVVTTVAWSDERPSYPGRTWVATAQQSLADAPRDAALLPQVLPPQVVDPTLAPDNRSDVVFAPLAARPPFASWTTRLRVFDDSGSLVPADIDGIDLAVPACEGSAVTIPMSTPLPEFAYIAAVTLTRAPSEGFRVRLGDSTPVAVGAAGPGTIFVQLTGAGSTVQVDGVGAGDLCVASVRLGQATVTEGVAP